MLNIENVSSFVDKVNAAGGGNTPEMMGDGLDAALNMKWRKEAKKFILYFLEAYIMANSTTIIPRSPTPPQKAARAKRTATRL